MAVDIDSSTSLSQLRERATIKINSLFPAARPFVSLLLAACLIIVALVNYSFALSNENAKLSQDKANLLSAFENVKSDYEKGVEKVTFSGSHDFSLVAAVPDGGRGVDTNYDMKVQIANDGPIVSTIRYVLLWCNSCPKVQGDPVISGSSLSPALILNSGDTKEMELGPVLDGREYQVQLISDTGNTIWTDECKVDFGKHQCASTNENAQNAEASN